MCDVTKCFPKPLSVVFTPRFENVHGFDNPAAADVQIAEHSLDGQNLQLPQYQARIARSQLRLQEQAATHGTHGIPAGAFA
jgi:hypothetical protein